MDNRAQVNQQTIDLQKQQRAEGEAEIARRAQAHKAQIESVRSGQARRPQVAGAAPKSSPLDLLALGDSWFDYPLTDDGLPSFDNSIVGASQLQSMGSPAPKIFSVALHGQSMATAMGLKNQTLMAGYVKDSGNWLSNSGLPDAILVSGGGDDIAGDQFIIYLDPSTGGLDSARFQGLLNSIAASYKDLFAFRDEFAPKVPIFGHCYDYAVPDGRGTLLGFEGPWLQPSINFAGVDAAEGLKAVADAIDGFWRTLDQLASDPKNDFTLIDTRGTLTRDALMPLGWANELHPYTAGFAALAKKFLAALQRRFSGRI